MDNETNSQIAYFTKMGFWYDSLVKWKERCEILGGSGNLERGEGFKI